MQAGTISRRNPLWNAIDEPKGSNSAYPEALHRTVKMKILKDYRGTDPVEAAILAATGTIILVSHLLLSLSDIGSFI
jgi:hypothetical protein